MAGHDERVSLSLDGAWDFRHDSGITGTAAVPGPWQAQFPALRHAMGRATYTRRFAAPAMAADRQAVLCFGAASDRAEVRLNGTLVGSHDGGWLPFECIVPDGLLRADNLIEVTCHLPEGFEDFAEIPHGKQSWYGPIGGLWQSVRLEVRARSHLRHCAIRCTNAGQVSVRLDGQGPAALTIRDPAGKVVAQTQADVSGPTDTGLHVDTPALWSPDTPALYSLEVALPGDRTRHSFGFREFTTRNGKFFLNGQPFYMRAALDQDYYPDTICTPPSEAYLEDQFRKARALGLNMLRCHIKVPDPRYYEVADRLGLLVWTEIPNVAQLTPASAARLRATMEGILSRDGNHPCIVIWTLINEDWGTRLCEDASHRAWLAQTYDWLKQTDPGRLVVDNSPCHTNFHVKSDINDFHYYRSIPERREEWDALTAEFAAGADWTYSPFGDAQRRGDEPLVVSEFGVWGLPDPALLRQGGEPWWMGTGSSWGDGVAYPHGIEDRFAELHLDRVFGSFDGFIGAAQGYQFANLKYEIESMRSYPSIQGYVLTEFTDVHWESNGLLDMNRNPRRFHADFARLNADAVILPVMDRSAIWAGQTARIGLSLASGGAALPPAEIEWQAEGLSGRLPTPAVAPLAVAALPDILLPATGPARMVRITLRLRSGGQTLAESYVDLAVHDRPDPAGLPAVSAPAERAQHLRALGFRVVDRDRAALHIVHALDAEDLATLQKDARFLLLADGSGGPALRTDPPRREPPFGLAGGDTPGLPARPDSQLPNMQLVERHGTIWRGDWIAGFSWVRREGALARLPGGPLLDLSWDRVVPHHVLTGFRTWEFGGPVLAGIVVGWVHKPAALVASRRVGRGSVVVSTFRLFNDAPGEDPVATALLAALAETAASQPVEGDLHLYSVS
ncbi:MAG: hypothetical protein RLZZ528_2177 [Pseudomonadota bacterium]